MADELQYESGDRIFLTAKDAGGATGTVIDCRMGKLPPYLGGGREEQVNVRLDTGEETGFIPATMVKLCVIEGHVAGLVKTGEIVTPKVVSSPVYGAPPPNDDDDGVDDADFFESEEEKAEVIAKFHEDLAMENAREMVEEAVTDERPVIMQTHDPVQGLPRCNFKGCDKPARGTAPWGITTVNACEDHMTKAVAAYVEPERKNPDSLARVVDELETVAKAIEKLAPQEQMEDWKTVRRVVIGAAITVKGCCAEWQSEREYERSKRPEYHVVMHKLLFFGPSNKGTELMMDMHKAGVLSELKMEDRLNELAREGWRVVFRHFDPSRVMRQWRVMLEKP